MSRELSKFIKVVLLLVAVIYCFDKIVYKSFSYASSKVLSGQSVGKINHFLQVKDEVDLLVFGSSRANHHVDSRELAGRSFNMGQDGTRLAFASGLVQTLDNERKQTILLHVDYDDLYDTEYSGDDIQRIKYLSKMYSSVEKNMKESGRVSLLDEVFWSNAYNGKVIGIIKNIISPTYDYTNYYGYDPIVMSTDSTSMRDNVFSKPIACPTQYYDINEVALNALLDIKALCDKKNKLLVAFTSPIYRYDCPISKSKLVNIFDELDIEYVNGQVGNELLLSRSYWKDRTHMNEAGAVIFTRELAEQLSEIIK